MRRSAWTEHFNWGKVSAPALLAAILLTFMLPFAFGARSVQAAGTVIVSVSSASGQVGDTVSVGVSVSADEGISAAGFMLSYDPSVVEFIPDGNSNQVGSGTALYVYSPSGTFTSQTFTMSFKIVGTGSSALTFSTGGQGFGNEMGDMMPVSVAGNGSISASAAQAADAQPQAPEDGAADLTDNGAADAGDSDTDAGDAAAEETETLDDNTELASLDVWPGSISFSADAHRYAFSVPEDTESLDVQAVPASSTSTVSVSDTALVMGENTITITVSAQSGATAEYTLTVMRGGQETEESTQESEDTETSAQETSQAAKKVTVLGTFESPAAGLDILALPEGVKAPEGFQKKKQTIGGVLTDTYVNADGLVLFYGRPSSDDLSSLSGAGWYVYDASTGTAIPAPKALLSALNAAGAKETESGVVDARWKVLAIALFILFVIMLVLFIISQIHGPFGKDPERNDELGELGLDDTMANDRHTRADRHVRTDRADDPLDDELSGDVLADSDGLPPADDGSGDDLETLDIDETQR